MSNLIKRQNSSLKKFPLKDLLNCLLVVTNEAATVVTLVA